MIAVVAVARATGVTGVAGARVRVGVAVGVEGVGVNVIVAVGVLLGAGVFVGGGIAVGGREGDANGVAVRVGVGGVPPHAATASIISDKRKIKRIFMMDYHLPCPGWVIAIHELLEIATVEIHHPNIGGIVPIRHKANPISIRRPRRRKIRSSAVADAAQAAAVRVHQINLITSVAERSEDDQSAVRTPDRRRVLGFILGEIANGWRFL